VACTVKRISGHNHKNGRGEDFAQHDGAQNHELASSPRRLIECAAADLEANERCMELRRPATQVRRKVAP
jgi:hypothetical protein